MFFNLLYFFVFFVSSVCFNFHSNCYAGKFVYGSLFNYEYVKNKGYSLSFNYNVKSYYLNHYIKYSISRNELPIYADVYIGNIHSYNWKFKYLNGLKKYTISVYKKDKGGFFLHKKIFFEDYIVKKIFYFSKNKKIAYSYLKSENKGFVELKFDLKKKIIGKFLYSSNGKLLRHYIYGSSQKKTCIVSRTDYKYNINKRFVNTAILEYYFDSLKNRFIESSSILFNYNKKYSLLSKLVYKYGAMQSKIDYDDNLGQIKLVKIYKTFSETSLKRIIKGEKKYSTQLDKYATFNYYKDGCMVFWFDTKNRRISSEKYSNGLLVDYKYYGIVGFNNSSKSTSKAYFYDENNNYKSISYYLDGNLNIKEIYEEGLLTSKKYYSDNNMKFYKQYLYNNLNYIKAERLYKVYETRNEIIQYIEYTYDKYNRLYTKTSIVKSDDSNNTTLKVFFYDEKSCNGRVAETKTFLNKSLVEKEYYNYKSQVIKREYGNKSELESTELYTYNKFGFLTRIKVYNQNSIIDKLVKIQYSRDPATGFTTRMEIGYDSKNTHKPLGYIMKYYNLSGNAIYKKEYYSHKFKIIETVYYNIITGEVSNVINHNKTKR